MRRAPPHLRKTKAPVLAKQKLLLSTTSTLELAVNKFLPNQSQEESSDKFIPMNMVNKNRSSKSKRKWVKKQLRHFLNNIGKNDKLYSFIILLVQEVVFHYIRNR